MQAPRPSPDEIEERMVALATLRGPGRTISPSDVARALAGDHPEQWGPLMPSVRRAAVRLMKAGRVVIYRKGRPVDANDFRGVYRIGIGEGAPE